mmetsp:Transcript_39486/g.93534  ORF Transcript_39486/g.93534 Transcript_39486/m.93534 type:complete len:543 (+) Transcript_39486:4459-6087(+)
MRAHRAAGQGYRLPPPGRRRGVRNSQGPGRERGVDDGAGVDAGARAKARGVAARDRAQPEQPQHVQGEGEPRGRGGMLLGSGHGLRGHRPPPAVRGRLLALLPAAPDVGRAVGADGDCTAQGAGHGAVWRRALRQRGPGDVDQDADGAPRGGRGARGGHVCLEGGGGARRARAFVPPPWRHAECRRGAQARAGDGKPRRGPAGRGDNADGVWRFLQDAVDLAPRAGPLRARGGHCGGAGRREPGGSVHHGDGQAQLRPRGHGIGDQVPGGGADARQEDAHGLHPGLGATGDRRRAPPAGRSRPGPGPLLRFVPGMQGAAGPRGRVGGVGRPRAFVPQDRKDQRGYGSGDGGAEDPQVARGSEGRIRGAPRTVRGVHDDGQVRDGAGGMRQRAQHLRRVPRSRRPRPGVGAAREDHVRVRRRRGRARAAEEVAGHAREHNNARGDQDLPGASLPCRVPQRARTGIQPDGAATAGSGVPATGRADLRRRRGRLRCGSRAHVPRGAPGHQGHRRVAGPRRYGHGRGQACGCEGRAPEAREPIGGG